MKKASAFVLSLSILILVLLGSCSNSVEDMISGYNSGFKPASTTYTTETTSDESDVVYEPGDDQFYAEDMLYPSYVISQNSTLNLAGPKNCSRYTWSMYDPDDETDTELKITLMNGYTTTTRKYVLYVPASGLYASKTFKLRLSVLGNDGHLYTDTCGISVYKDYYFSESSNRSVVSESDSSSGISRMILPDAYSVSDENLYYYLYAKSSVTGKIYGPDRINVTKDTSDASGKTGSIFVDLPKSNYYMTLYCTKGLASNESSTEVIKADSVLIGYATADLRYNQDVSFYMTSKDLTRAGYFQIKVYTDGWSLNDTDYPEYTVSAEVVNTDGTSVDVGYTTELTNSNLTANTAPANPNLNFTIAPGTYTLKISFSNGTKTFSWSDNIVIISGNTTEATIGLPLIIFDDSGGG